MVVAVIVGVVLAEGRNSEPITDAASTIGIETCKSPSRTSSFATTTPSEETEPEDQTIALPCEDGADLSHCSLGPRTQVMEWEGAWLWARGRMAVALTFST